MLSNQIIQTYIDELQGISKIDSMFMTWKEITWHLRRMKCLLIERISIPLLIHLWIVKLFTTTIFGDGCA